MSRRGAGVCSSGLDHRPGLGDPAVALDAAVQLEVAVELGDVARLHGGELPVVEDAGLVELLLELRADAVELGQIVRSAARGGEALELLACSAGGGRIVRRQLLGDRVLGGADIDARGAWPREMPSMAARAIRSQ